ncbi:hypothetical protein N752_22190 [Desulforamulus aquiferis]|nr:hypothetical protein N752_22190 [Desulforamulus aquiferis]
MRHEKAPPCNRQFYYLNCLPQGEHIIFLVRGRFFDLFLLLGDLGQGDTTALAKVFAWFLGQFSNLPALLTFDSVYSSNGFEG